MKEENIIEELKRKVEEGGQVTREEALALSRVEDRKAFVRGGRGYSGSFCGAVFRYLLDRERPFGTLF